MNDAEIFKILEGNRKQFDKQESVTKDKFDYVEQGQGFWARLKLKLFWGRIKKESIMVHMEMTNGIHTHFIAKVYKNAFEWQGKTFITDDTLKYYDTSAKLYCLDYHEDICMPIRRKIDVNSIKKTISLPGVTDVDNAINPTTLRLFIESEIAQKILKGEDLEAIFGLLKKLLMITMIVGIITLLLVLNMSGVFKNVMGGG